MASVTDREKEKLKEVYRKYDTDGSGRLSFEEFFNMLRILNSSWEEADAQTLFQSCDQDLSGDMDFDEFVDYISGDDSGQTLYRLEKEHDEEEAKEALLIKPHLIRSEASKTAKERGLVWRDMTWRERLELVCELEKGSAEDKAGRVAHAPCHDKASHHLAHKKSSDLPIVEKASKEAVKEEEPVEVPMAERPSTAPAPATSKSPEVEEVKDAKRPSASASAQPVRVNTKKFGIAGMNQEAIVKYSLSSDDLAFADGDPVADQFKTYLMTAPGPLDAVNIIKFIAKGTAGFVFLAEWKDSGQRMAMKIIRMTQAASGVREWYISKKLVEHSIENVVLTSEKVYVLEREHAPDVVMEQVKDAGPVPYYMCMIQDLMPWGTLEDLAAEGELSPAIMFQALDDVAKTLAAMHDHHIQHKDVKPENIMLVMKDKVVTAAKLCDLGSSTMGDNKKARADDIRRFGVTIFSIATGEGWTKNRLIREDHGALIERLTEGVAEAEDENMKNLPDLLAQILDGGLSMQEVADLVNKIASSYS